MDSLTIPRYSRDDFITRLVTKMETLGYPLRTIAPYCAKLRTGSIGLTLRKADTFMDMLELTTAERAEFRRHFYGGD